MSRILVVDDEVEILSTVKSLLEGDGQTIETHSDPIQAMYILQKERYDLLLLDINMPKMNGIELLESVKERYPLTEVIMLTAQGTANSSRMHEPRCVFFICDFKY